MLVPTGGRPSSQGPAYAVAMSGSTSSGRTEPFAPGFRVGHHTDLDARTGCTVIIPPQDNVASCDVRGSSPGSREIESLRPENRLNGIHGLLLTGGSAWGLGAADGVMRYLAENGFGYDTPMTRIPIVPTAVVFDLGTGDAHWPGPDEGYAACSAAREREVEVGRVGAGTGCTVGKWAGREHHVPGGLGIGCAEENGETAWALAVVNSIGDVIGEDGSVLAGTTNPEPKWATPPGPRDERVDTVLAVVAFRARITKREAHFLAGRGSDGITTSVRPAHTRYDGDVVFAIGAPGEGEGDPDVDLLGVLATRAVAAAVRNAVV